MLQYANEIIGILCGFCFRPDGARLRHAPGRVKDARRRLASPAPNSSKAAVKQEPQDDAGEATNSQATPGQFDIPAKHL